MRPLSSVLSNLMAAIAKLPWLGRLRLAALSTFKRKPSAVAAVLGSMSWPEFEMLAAESFRRRGFTVSSLVCGGAEGGFDLVMKRRGLMYLVQCKHWRTRCVGAPVVRELSDVMKLHSADGGYVLTAGVFTAEARRYAEDARIELMDGTALSAMVLGIGNSSVGVPAGAGSDPEFARVPVEREPTPACPQCGAQMVRRTAKQGTMAGTEFWGCSTFPTCSGTRVEWTRERRRAS